MLAATWRPFITSANLTILIDSGLKARAAQVAARYNLDLDSTIRALREEMAGTSSLPPAPQTRGLQRVTVAALREAEAIAGDGDRWYEDGASLMRAALT